MKNKYAVALGRRGGLKGGKARAEKLPQERRREIASTAGRSRWAKVDRRCPTKAKGLRCKHLIKDHPEFHSFGN